jgi:flavodoxin
MVQPMSSTLVVYYSWTGHTRQIAEAVAGEPGADLEEIREVNPRAGWIAYLRSAWEVLRGKAVPIAPVEKSLASYDLVVLGTPVWVGRMASPVRAYIDQQWPRLNRIALFCTQGGTDGEKTLAQIAGLSGKRPLATLVVSEAELKSGMWRRKVAAFVKRLGQSA